MKNYSTICGCRSPEITTKASRTAIMIDGHSCCNLPIAERIVAVGPPKKSTVSLERAKRIPVAASSPLRTILPDRSAAIWRYFRKLPSEYLLYRKHHFGIRSGRVELWDRSDYYPSVIIALGTFLLCCLFFATGHPPEGQTKIVITVGKT